MDKDKLARAKAAVKPQMQMTARTATLTAPARNALAAQRVVEKPRPVVLNCTRALVMSMRTDRF